MWARRNGNCGPQTLTSHGPGNWSVTANQAAGNTAVLTYPDTQQLFTLSSGAVRLARA
jgi:hypothetical protein